MIKNRKVQNGGVIYWLRWGGVLPLSLLASIIALFPLHWILITTLSQFVEPYPELPERILTPFILAFIFIWIGSVIAPKYRFETSIALFGILLFIVGGFVFLTISGGTWMGYELLFIGGALGPIMAVLGSIIGLLVVRKSNYTKFQKSNSSSINPEPPTSHRPESARNEEPVGNSPKNEEPISSTNRRHSFPSWGKWMVGLGAVGIILVIGIPNLTSSITVQAPTSINYAVGHSPVDICFDGTNIWVTNWWSGNITKLKASDGSILGTYNAGSYPHGICFDGTNIWVANSGNNNVTKLKGSDGFVLGTYPVGTKPQGICFDGTNIWTANDESNNVTKLRASNGTRIGNYDAGSHPLGICFDGTNIWVTNGSGKNVTKLRASDGTILGAYKVGTYPYGICFDGTNIWVANSGDNNVTKVKASDGAILGTYKVGAGPYGICFDGTNIWTANNESKNVTKLKASNGTRLVTYAAGSFPSGICFDGTNIWVTNSGSSSITKLK